MKVKDKNLMVTISGGRSSATMARYIQTSEKYKDYEKVYVFANTGQERKETIDFLKNIVNKWDIPLVMIEGVYSHTMNVGVSYKIVDFETLSMDSTPFEGAIMHKNKGEFNGVPHSEAPYCSQMLKTLPCKKLCDDVFGVNNYQKAIGMRKEDMPKRITWKEIEEDKTRIFPLLTDFETPVDNPFLNQWWNKQSFKLMIHNKFGNCELCWKKSDNNLIDAIRFGVSSETWWFKMEQKYGNTAFRNRKSIIDLVKMASMPYTPEIDFGQENYNCVCSF